ncbi:uncharacterized protein BDV17DRAFT_267609 [Aspergillus undulatus]|uniref:uncharacterized protein n=1 Tax=Aspergillus undulatus TaxID=1810928 RepID=UPI003CCD67EF
MSRHTPPMTTLSNGFGGTKAATPQDASGLFQTLQGHVDDIRNLLQCGICIRPLYEPFTLACGHTFCYGCLTSWFAEGRNNKTCPDCRAPVKSQPAPAYLVRAVVQLFTSRAELLDKGETTDQHVAHQSEEAGRIEADKKNTDPNYGGLFRGIFSKARHPPAQPIIDLEDGVMRCPECSWELEETGCVNCGYRHGDDSMSDTDYSEDSSEMTDDRFVDHDEEIDDDFGEEFDFREWYDGVPMDALPTGIRVIPNGGNVFGIPGAIYDPRDSSDFDGPSSSVHHDDEDEEDDEEDEDMDSFIDDGEPTNYGSDSGRSTIVGHPSYSRGELHAMFDSSSPAPMLFDHLGVRNGEDDEDEDASEDDDESETSETSETESDSDLEVEDEDEAPDLFGDDDESGDDVDDDDDDHEEPVRLATVGSRQRIPTYHILSSSSPVRASGSTANPNTNNQAGQQSQSSAGLSANHAIALDDDSDEEGPVAPTRRVRARVSRRQ